MPGPDPKMAAVNTEGWLRSCICSPLLSYRVELEAAWKMAKQPWSMSSRRKDTGDGWEMGKTLFLPLS